MGIVSFFADGRDAKALREWLSADPEIAFIVQEGPARRVREVRLSGDHWIGIYRVHWRAVAGRSFLKDEEHTLWHVPSGKLPYSGSPDFLQTIPDPWAGWIEESPREHGFFLKPWFEGHPGIFHLDLRSDHRQGLLEISNIQWSWLRGSPGEATWNWWRRLEEWVGQAAAHVWHEPVDSLDPDGEVVDFWAFPSALARLQRGMTYYANGFRIDAGIQAARIGPRLPFPLEEGLAGEAENL